jgi:hypothetical protein
MSKDNSIIPGDRWQEAMQKIDIKGTKVVKEPKKPKKDNKNEPNKSK